MGCEIETVLHLNRPLFSILKGGGENGVFSLIYNFCFSHPFFQACYFYFLSLFDLHAKAKIRLDFNHI